MKFLYFIYIAVIINSQPVYSQLASGYFPQQSGFTWKYELTPLDSLNNPVDLQTFFRADSFAATDDFQGELANIVVSKTGTIDLIHSLPYTDSLFYHFSGAVGNEYLRIGNLELVLTALDSIISDSAFSFVDMFKSLENWYSVYKFDAGVNQSYSLISVDTTISFNNINFPLRFDLRATRFEDDTLDTEIGTFVCKRFFVERGVSFLIIYPPLPPIPIPIAFFNDTVWIAPENWMVKKVMPATEINLALITGDTLFVPGLQTRIISDITGIENSEILPSNFLLSQNYPNPFNPSTKIQFQITESGLTHLKVFDLLGNEIYNLLNRELAAGEYEVEFDAGSLPSGVYFYQLKTTNNISTKKMVLIK
jgi:hypothetical protein